MIQIIENTEKINLNLNPKEPIIPYKIMGRFSYLDTKTANKNLKTNDQQLKKLESLLNQKIDDKIKNRKKNIELEKDIFDRMLNRILNKIEINKNKLNYMRGFIKTD